MARKSSFVLFAELHKGEPDANQRATLAGAEVIAQAIDILASAVRQLAASVPKAPAQQGPESRHLS